MNAFFKVKAFNEIYSGVVFGEDEKDIMAKTIECYEPEEVTFFFGECFDGNIVELADLKESPLFDFQ